MLRFTKLRWKNFLSTGNRWTEVELDQHPTTLVMGKNGSGKSTMIEALTFALFGKPFRKINKPQLVNTINQKDCVVEVEFLVGNVDYKITRGIAPAIFEITRKGKPLDQESKSNDFQKYLERNILSLSYKSFTQIVILGSSSYVPFMKLTAADRRIFNEDLLDITIFSSMNTVLKMRAASVSSALDTNESRARETASRLKLQREYVGKMETKVSDIIETKHGAIAEIQEKIKDAEEKRDKLQAVGAEVAKVFKAAGVDKLGKKKNQLFEYETKMKQRLKGTKGDLRFFTTNDTCPTCQQDITEEYKNPLVESRETKKEELEAGLNALKEQVDSVQAAIDSAMKLQDQINEINGSIAELTNKVSMYQRSIDQHQNEIEDLSKDHSGEIKAEKAKMKSTRDILASLETERKGLLKQRKVFDIAAEMLKDSGIKTKIIRQYLPTINKLINKYLSEMNFFVQFTLDENFKESIQSRFKDNFSYASFSEGQKMRIDLALLFTWVEIARTKNSTNTNLLFLDEVFDSSLDEDGTDDLMKLLKNSIAGKNVYVISQNADKLLDKFNDSIEFELHNNYSRRVS